jgi:C-terminal processing protease CtpA/Prc
MAQPASVQELVAAADDSVRAALSTGQGLGDFLATIDKLEPHELNEIVTEAIKLLEGFYVHLPLKRAMHAVDPLQRLRLLLRRATQMSSEIAFHHEMTEIFTSLRDLHTNYVLPTHFGRMIAYLPFRVDACFEAGKRQYIVAQTAEGLDQRPFEKGVRLIYWNGVPIDRAVEIAASYHAGSNAAARHSRGVAGLTKRAMNIAPPPDEEWVTIIYQDLNGRRQDFRADWTISELPDDPVAAAELGIEAAAAYGMDLEGDTFRRINKMLFNQQLYRESRRIEGAREAARARASTEESTQSLEAIVVEAATDAVQGTQSTLPDFFTARVEEVDGRKFGYIRIHTFNARMGDGPFVDEFVRLIGLPEMPKDGLIIDVRGNGGGLIWAGERLLQLFTPNRIEPCRLQFINTALNLQLCSRVPSLKAWEPSLQRALETGAAFSAGFPITPVSRCNDIGQRYYGPVLVITDARCYSTTDIFAAGFQDHKIGTILGTDDNTGAGGANVWTLDQVRQFFAMGGLQPPLEQLPKGANMRVAIRRTLRVGDEAGTELEDLGVKPDRIHHLTRDDILHEFKDLIAAAGRELADKEIFGFEAGARRADGKLDITLNTKGVEYVAVAIAKRQRGSHNVANDRLQLKLPVADEFVLPANAVEVELWGYSVRDQLVCYRRLSA